MSLNLPEITASFARSGGPLSAGAVQDVLGKSQAKSRLIRKLLLALIVIPTGWAILYYGLLASDRYVSEANIIVRSVSSKRMSGLEMIFQTFGISRAVDDSNAVQNYMLSRDAVRALQDRLPLREIFSNPKGDYLARFPRFWLTNNQSFERLYEYYTDRVSITQDQTKGITTVRVVTFDAQESYKIVTELMKLSEEMINRMNMRAQGDTVRSAETSMERAIADLMESQKKLTVYRNRELIVDPSKSSASVLETMTTLATENAQVLAQIQEMSKLTPNSPGIAARQARADALKTRIASEREKLAGGDDALARKIEVFEQLALMREIAEKNLTSASQSLESARQEARRQQIYIEEIVRPHVADQSTDPERLRMIATVLVTSSMLAAVLWLLSAGAQEHSH